MTCENCSPGNFTQREYRYSWAHMENQPASPNIVYAGALYVDIILARAFLFVGEKPNIRGSMCASVTQPH